MEWHRWGLEKSGLCTLPCLHAQLCPCDPCSDQSSWLEPPRVIKAFLIDLQRTEGRRRVKTKKSPQSRLFGNPSTVEHAIPEHFEAAKGCRRIQMHCYGWSDSVDDIQRIGCSIYDEHAVQSSKILRRVIWPRAMWKRRTRNVADVAGRGIVPHHL